MPDLPTKFGVLIGLQVAFAVINLVAYWLFNKSPAEDSQTPPTTQQNSGRAPEEPRSGDAS